MVTTICNSKGGVGKTTIAVNLAVALAYGSADVLLVDGDEQASALGFTEIRMEKQGERPRYTAVALYGAGLHSQVQALAGRYAHVVIDVGGRDTKSLRSALVVSDLVIIPTAPRSFDLWALAGFLGVLGQARELHAFRAITVLNSADVMGADNQAAREFLGELDGIEVSPHALVKRKAFPNSSALGLGVLEYTDTKASAEFRALYESLFPVAVLV